MKITSRPFGVTEQGDIVTEYVFSARGISVSVLNYGGIVTKIVVPDKNGKPTDVVLGYDRLSAYEKNPAYLGACIGRVAGRQRGATVTVNGKEYALTKNDNANHLHGIFSHKVFSAVVSEDSLWLHTISPASEEGYPGDLDFSVRYSLNEDGIFGISYTAKSTEDTPVNFTNHSYFNLSGHASGRVTEQKLRISADEIWENDDETCPTGERLPVADTPFDFRTLAPIGQGFPLRGEQMEFAGGYDHCFCLREDAEVAAIAHSEKTGITLEMVTTEPGVVFYSGNYLGDSGEPGKDGAVYDAQDGFCLETGSFPVRLLRAGEVFRSTTLYKFLTLK